MPQVAGRAGRELTPIQVAILDFVVQHTRRRGYPPTYREIGGAVNLRSGSAVSYQADVLEEM